VLFQIGEILKYQPMDEAIGASDTLEQRTLTGVIAKDHSLPGEVIGASQPEADYQMLESASQPTN
jgi:hypothetical protein